MTFLMPGACPIQAFIANEMHGAKRLPGIQRIHVAVEHTLLFLAFRRLTACCDRVDGVLFHDICDCAKGG